METEERGRVYEWRIENLSHWCAEVHGHCIQSPKLHYPCLFMELYPKGIGGQGEHLVVRLIHVYFTYSGELSFHSSDGFLMCNKQQVNADEGEDVLVLPPGPKFEDVLSRIREGEDFITLKLRFPNSSYNVKDTTCSTINVFKIQLEINPRWIEKYNSEARKAICDIHFSSENPIDRIKLYACSKNNTVHFIIEPPTNFEYPFAVEMSVLSRGSDGTVDSCAKREHLFRDEHEWTFPDPLRKKELAGNKGISLLLCLKTKHPIQSHNYLIFDSSYISMELNNTPCLSEKAPSTNPVTSDKVLTKDYGIQTSLDSDMPDDSVLVLSKELMCLYQDQDFSDITLKCDSVTFPVHKNILSARSPVFKTMLSTDMAEASSGEVDIGDLDPSTLSRFLTFLYTGALEGEVQCDRALKLYYAADKYQVPVLRRECAKFLCASVSILNVFDILSLADKHQDHVLTAASHNFILNNYNSVLKSNEWAGFMSREPLLAVKTLTHFATKDRVRMHDPK